MATTGTVPEGTPAPAAPPPIQQPDAPQVAQVVNPDVDSNLRDLSFLVDESDLPPAGQRHALSERLQAMLAPTPAEAQSTVTNQQPQPDSPPQGETAQQKADRLWAQKYTTPEALEQGYLESQRLMTEKATALADLRRQYGDADPRVVQEALGYMNWYKTTYEPWARAQHAQAMQQPAQTQQVQQQPEETAETRPKGFLEMSRDELLDAFSEDPKKAMMGFFNELTAQPGFVEQQVPELAQSRAADRILREFTALETAHPDAIEVLPTMDSLYKAHPALKQYPMEAVYMIAKGAMYDQLKATQTQAVQNAATIATQAAYNNQQAKLHGAVEGAMSIEPGATPGRRDEFDEMMEWNKNRQKVV